MITEETLAEHEQARGTRQMPERTEPAAVRLRRLVKRYKDGTEANRGIDLDVRRGELISILGPNGAGKTTFLRQISTELRPSGGSLEIFGINAVAAPKRVKQM